MPRLSLLWRLPIRLRLTLLFSGVMAVLLAALSGFLYLHFRSDLDYNINQSLRARAQEIASLDSREVLKSQQGAPTELPVRGENFVQILDRQGHVLAASAGFDEPAVLHTRQIDAAANGPLLLTQRSAQRRLFSIPVNHGRAIVVAGVSLAERDAALDKLEDALAIGGPLALLLASLAAYGLAAAALRPVESMRRQAARISSSDTSTRLPLPDSVDEIHRLGSTLNEMLDRLHDSLERERAFLADASHELRTPLTVLKAELEVTLREDPTVARLREALSSAAEETDRIVRLAEGLLVLARAERGRLPIRRQQITVTELLRDLGERSAMQARHLQGSVLVSPAPCESLVAVDLDRLGQALGNLIDNALRYGRGTITLTARVLDGFLELHVTDRGDGFHAEFLPRAFERFSREDPARSRGGAGLGLAIVKTIAKAHDGEAYAANLSQGGADVWLTIPCQSA